MTTTEQVAKPAFRDVVARRMAMVMGVLMLTVPSVVLLKANSRHILLVELMRAMSREPEVVMLVAPFLLLPFSIGGYTLTRVRRGEAPGRGAAWGYAVVTMLELLALGGLHVLVAFDRGGSLATMHLVPFTAFALGGFLLVRGLLRDGWQRWQHLLSSTSLGCFLASFLFYFPPLWSEAPRELSLPLLLLGGFSLGLATSPLWPSKGA